MFHLSSKKSEIIHDINGSNPIREKLKDRNSVDFSTATLRRLALLSQKRDLL